MSRGLRLVAGLALVPICGMRSTTLTSRRGPLSVPGASMPTDSGALLARALAPLLYIQRDEWFPLERVVAVAPSHPPIIAYHLLWRDDVHGSWIPFTVPTDEEVVWVGYDSTRAPTDIWTFWHGPFLHADWRDRGQVAIDVQWGKHGSLPHRAIESDLACARRSSIVFYAFTWIGLPDIWLGDLTRRGPLLLLSRLRAVSRLLEDDAARRSPRRRRSRRRRDRRRWPTCSAVRTPKNAVALTTEGVMENGGDLSYSRRACASRRGADLPMRSVPAILTR